MSSTTNNAESYPIENVLPPPCKLERQNAICEWLLEEKDEDGTICYYVESNNHKKYICIKCKKSYYDKNYLKNHMNKYNNETEECTKDDLYEYH